MSPARAAALFARSDDVSLGSSVLEVLRRAQASHPAFDVDDVSFVQRLGELCSGHLDRLRSLATADLWLAHAAASGCPRALETFEQDVFGPRVEAIRRRFTDEITIEDEAQVLRLRLVAEDEPLLLNYRGHGSLQGWVSVSLGRAVAKSRARRRRAAEADIDAVGDTLVDELDLPTLAERAEAKAILTAALRDAISSIGAEQRLLLKLHICDRLAIDELAPLLGVHRATASRRLERARRALADEVRAQIKGAHRLDSAAVDSLLRGVRSSFHSAVGTFLAS